jgi:hypothetical protein
MSDFIVDEVKEVNVEEQVELVNAQGQHIILFEDCVAALIGDDTSQIQKRITYEDFGSIINSILNRRNEESLEGFQLPANCFFFAKSGNSIQLSCYYAERIAEMAHLDTKYTLKTPNFIISHKLEKHNGKQWRVTESRFFCTDSKVGALPKGLIWDPDHSNHVFLSPFPNTYPEGRMCYGGNSMPSIFQDNNLQGLNWYYQFLFESPFNNDLGLRSIRGDDMTINQWFELLAQTAKDNLAFPYNKLRGYSR